MNLLNDLMGMGGEEMVDTKRVFAKAPFSMPGGKSRSLDALLPLLPVRKRWVDHFGGTGVVSLNRPECDVFVFNDRHSGIIDFYRCLHDDTWMRELREILTFFPTRSREWFERCKIEWCDELDITVRAAKWYYMLRCSVNQVGRNFGRSINTRYGLGIAKKLDLFEAVHHQSKNWIIENLDFEILFHDYDGLDTVHYFDPPYKGTDGGAYTHGYENGLLDRILKCVQGADGFCALSGYMDEQVDACDFWTALHTWEVSVTTDSKDGQPSTECLWIKE